MDIDVQALKTKHLRTACFTGHRLIPKNHLLRIKAALENEIMSQYEQGISIFLNGGAVGFDMLAAEAVISLKASKELPIRLEMILPYGGHSEKWKEADKTRLTDILKSADSMGYVLGQYQKNCFQTRNNYLVTHSSVCIAYMTFNRSGTGQTVRMAQNHGLTIINLAEKIKRKDEPK